MSTSSKKILLAVVALLIAGALGCYFFFIPGQEKKYEQNIAAFIKELPGDLAADAIKVNFLGNSAEIRGLRGTTQYLGNDISVDLASLTLTGLNFNLGKETGVNKLADSLIIADASVKQSTTVPGLPQPITQDFTFKNFELHNVRGDFNAVADLLGDASLERKMDIAATFSAGPVRLKDYVQTTNTALGAIIMRLASLEAQESSLLTAKNTVWEKMSLTAFNAEVMGIDRMTQASMKMPNILAPLIEFMDMRREFDSMSAIFLEKIRQEPIEMRGLVIEGFRFQFMTPEPITIGRLSMDLEASADRLAFKKDIQGLILPPSIYGPMSLEAALFSDFYAKSLDIDLNMDVVLTHKSGAPVEIMINNAFIRDKNLASAQLRANILHTGDMQHVYGVFDSDGDIVLKSAELVLEDKNLVGAFLEAEFKTPQDRENGEDQVSVADLREQVAQSIAILYAGEGEDQTALREGLIKLIKAPGRLTITSAPEAPVNLATPEDDILNALRLKVEYTPAN